MTQKLCECANLPVSIKNQPNIVHLSHSIDIPEAIRDLPIAEVVLKVRDALSLGNVALHAAPGAGKSTGLPLALLSKATPTSRIVMLEPRRLAARSVAERLALHTNEPLGKRIGLRMRGETLVSDNTCLEVVTEGVLTRMLQADPTMAGIWLVIFDEFHERSLHADLGLALTLEVQQALRDDLRLLLMSATLDAVEISTRMGRIQQVSCAGRQHPVDIQWLGATKEAVAVRVAKAVNQALSNEQGDVLVFLPGVAQIEQTARIIEPTLTNDQRLYRLHGAADAKTQRAATAPASQHLQRIILSTSIAETSITIDGVRVVVDAGLERRARTDSSTGAQRLETVTASQASATQRAGRAGRTAAGVCYRLWSETDHARRAVSWQAEIMRADLSGTVMELGQWGATDVTALPWLEPPPAAGIARAQSLLTSLGIWANDRLTDHGIAVAKLPVHPRLGHMLLWAAQHGESKTACTLAVVLEDGGLRHRDVDLEIQLQHSVPQHNKRRIAQLQKMLNELSSDQQSNRTQAEKSSTAQNAPSIGLLLAQAYPDWIAKRRSGDDAKFALSCGAGATIAPDDPLAHQPWLAIARLGGAAREARVFLAAALDVDELQQWAPELFTSVKKMEWDDARERVVAEQQKRLGSLVVETKTITDISDDEKALALLNGIRKRGIDCLPWNDECRQWQARVQMMRRLVLGEARAQASQWPSVDDETLVNQLESWLLVWLHGKSSLKALVELDLLTILKAMLDYQQQQTLDALLPERYTVPSGSKIKLRYSNDDNPVLSVKLQEMFGCLQNPSVANGQVLLKVELLSPAQRPIQLTADLVNFWTDDPVNAKPTAYAKRRKR